MSHVLVHSRENVSLRPTLQFRPKNPLLMADSRRQVLVALVTE